MAPAAAGSLVSWTTINERLITATFKHQIGHLTAVVIYAPTENADQAKKDSFYGELDDVILATPREDLIVCLGTSVLCRAQIVFRATRSWGHMAVEFQTTIRNASWHSVQTTALESGVLVQEKDNSQTVVVIQRWHYKGDWPHSRQYTLEIITILQDPPRLRVSLGS